MTAEVNLSLYDFTFAATASTISAAIGEREPLS